MNNRLKELRESAGYTQEQLGSMVGVTNEYISMIERGIRSPGFKLAVKIADTFKLKIEEVFLHTDTY